MGWPWMIGLAAPAAGAVAGVAPGTPRSRSRRPGRLGRARGGLGGMRRGGREGQGERTEETRYGLHEGAKFSCQSRDFYNERFTMMRTTPCRLLQRDRKAVRPGRRRGAPALAWTHTARFLTTASALGRTAGHRAAGDRLRPPLERRSRRRSMSLRSRSASPSRRRRPAAPSTSTCSSSAPSSRPTRFSQTCLVRHTPPWSATPSCAGRR